MSLERVTDRAAEFAAGREAENVGTTDILFAVLDVYGKLFDRVLYLRGTSRDELVERLTAAAARALERRSRRSPRRWRAGS